MKNIVLFWGPLFVGAPVRPNMLNMPKSASAAGYIDNANGIRNLYQNIYSNAARCLIPY